MTDPPRWLDAGPDLPSSLLEVIEGAAKEHSECVDGATVESLRQRLVPLLSAGASEPPPGPSSATAGTGGAAARGSSAITSIVSKGAVLVGLVGVGLFLMLPSPSSPRPASVAKAVPTVSMPPDRHAPDAPVQASDVAVQAPDIAAQSVETPHANEPTVEVPDERPPVARPRRDPFLVELALVERAQRLASREPGTALVATEEHRRRFAEGQLREEREVHAIDALSRLGRREEAVARASAFWVRYPHSSYRARIDASLQRLSGVQ